jgi:hypothetical protein
MYSFNRFTVFALSVFLITEWSGADQPFVKQADEPPRLALLCEHQDPELLSLSEQVEVLLSQRNDLAVLDRANIDRILREQELSANQSYNMESYLQIGKLLRSDLLIVVNKHNDYLAWRLIDVHEGILAGVHVTRWPAEQRAAAIAEIEKAINRAVEKTRNAHKENMQYLAIVRFVNQDISRQHDSLEEVLPILISANLSAQPEIGLVERSQLSKISEEKLITEGSESGYKAGTQIIKGKISIIRDKEITSVSVTVSAEKPGQQAYIHFTCESPLQDIAELAQNISKHLPEHLSRHKKKNYR